MKKHISGSMQLNTFSPMQNREENKEVRRNVKSPTTLKLSKAKRSTATEAAETNNCLSPGSNTKNMSKKPSANSLAPVITSEVSQNYFTSFQKKTSNGSIRKNSATTKQSKNLFSPSSGSNVATFVGISKADQSSKAAINTIRQNQTKKSPQKTIKSSKP